MIYWGIQRRSRRVSVPLYEYKCLKCGRLTEKIESVSGPHLHKCPHCGGKVEALLSAPAIQFKGSGWYVTDYAGKSAGREAGSNDDKSSVEKPSGDKKEAASNDAGVKEAAAKEPGSKETKSEKKTSERAGKKK
jgi:putative FmdB family regulatory protein